MKEFVGIDLGGTKTMVACFKDGKITRRVMEKTPINLNDGVYELEVTAVNDKDKTGSAKIKFGVKVDWNATPTP